MLVRRSASLVWRRRQQLATQAADLLPPLAHHPQQRGGSGAAPSRGMVTGGTAMPMDMHGKPKLPKKIRPRPPLSHTLYRPSIAPNVDKTVKLAQRVGLILLRFISACPSAWLPCC